MLLAFACRGSDPSLLLTGVERLLEHVVVYGLSMVSID